MDPTIVSNLLNEIQITPDSTISKTLYSDAFSKSVLFAFDSGQELSEHTASMPASIHFLKGEAEVTLGNQSLLAIAGTWIHMPANLPHSVKAKSGTIMILTLMKSGRLKSATSSSEDD